MEKTVMRADHSPEASEIVSSPTVHRSRMILKPDEGTGWYVASQSDEGGWWFVTEDLHCGCPGYSFKGNCRHVRIIVAAGLADPRTWRDGDFLMGG